jgi:hypothetical protein
MIDSNTMLQQLLQGGAVQQSAFTTESRYYGMPVASFSSLQGEQAQYVRRRFIPPPERFALMQRYRVLQGDRIDVVAGSVLGEPLFYWRICDANLALDPDEATATPGAFIRIPLPAGVPGA